MNKIKLKYNKKFPIFVTYKNTDQYFDDYYSSEDEDDDKGEPSLNLTENIKKIKTLKDLIEICQKPNYEFFPCNYDDLKRLKKIKYSLMELDSLIGMVNVKTNFSYQALFYCQNLHKIKSVNGDNDSMLHTLIYGPPGSGKTTLAKIIGKIYHKLSIVKTDKFIIAKRKDLIGEYLGLTAIKTTKVLESALDGVLFIDEAYSLGEKEDTKDIFAKECINTINQFLTDYKKNIVVILAGYKDKMKEGFFSHNPGLERRFPWVYEIADYTSEQIRGIFFKQLKDKGWKLDSENSVPLDFFSKNKTYFEFSGGSTENYLDKCRLAHGRNTFGLPFETKGKLTGDDIINGLALHKDHLEYQKDKNDNWKVMYN